MNIPPLSTILTALGGAAGITGVICTLVGTAPSSIVGKAVQGVVSGVLVLISSWHATSVVATTAKAKAVAATMPATTV